MKDYHEPYSAGHLTLGGSAAASQQTFKCRICEREFSSINPNSLHCEKCRPLARQQMYRKLAEKRKRQRAAARGKV